MPCQKTLAEGIQRSSSTSWCGREVKTYLRYGRTGTADDHNTGAGVPNIEKETKPMPLTDMQPCDTTALTQSCDASQRCANPFCKGAGVVVKSARGKHGRYCCDLCRMDGYVLRRAQAMLNEVGTVEFNQQLMESSERHR